MPDSVTFQTLLVERDTQVVTVTINRPTKLNALNAQVLSELLALFMALDAEPPATRVRAAILTGAGEKAFVAGADILEMSALTPAAAHAFSLLGHRLGRVLEEASFPVLAAVNGFALGGGAELALCADFIFAAEHAKFGQPETNLGLMPGFGGTQRLARRIGIGRARELIYTGEPIDAARAYEIGLVNRIFRTEELLPKTKACAERIAGQAPLAVAASKRVIHRGFDADLSVANELESSHFADLFATDDAREGMSAFLTKRKPAYKAS